MTIPELKPAIVDEVAAIDEDLRRCVYGIFQTHLQQCNAAEAIYLM
jgi:acyl-CoA reductase-like NAD-dependent aldehyde dehydrogenase